MKRKLMIAFAISAFMFLATALVYAAPQSGSIDTVLQAGGTTDMATAVKRVIDAIKLPVQILTVGLALVLALIRGMILAAIQDERKRAEVAKGFLFTLIGLGIVFFGITIFSAIINSLVAQKTTLILPILQLLG